VHLKHEVLAILHHRDQPLLTKPIPVQTLVIQKEVLAKYFCSEKFFKMRYSHKIVSFSLVTE
jgi:hypothetical protein